VAKNLILASTSPYRARLLNQLGLVYRQVAPDYTEHGLLNEAPFECCQRLALGKAQAVARQLNEESNIIIGSDQVAHLGDRIFHKPGDMDSAIAQLQACSNQWVSFSTAIALLGPSDVEVAAETYQIKFRDLSDQVILHYLEKEQPFDCAGSIRAEGLGIALIENSHGRDINALYGLPLMLLSDMLIRMGSENLIYNFN
jgi:MAF protein